MDQDSWQPLPGCEDGGLIEVIVAILPRAEARKNQPSQPPKVDQANPEEQERETQPQTAALPGGSCST